MYGKRLPHTRDSMITNIKMFRWNPTRVTKYKFNKNQLTYENTYQTLTNMINTCSSNLVPIGVNKRKFGINIFQE